MNAKLNNDIRQLVRPGQIRLVNLDLDSPRMQQAMQILGYERDDLDTKKRREHFIHNNDPTNQKVPSPKGKDMKTLSKELIMMDPEEIDEELL